MTSLALPRTDRPARRPAADLKPRIRIALATGALAILALIGVALTRALLFGAPGAAALREVALAVHLAAVIPALPLGAWVLLARKGSPRHRLLGKIWLALMVTGAVSALWVRHLNDGRLSAIHLLVPVVLAGAWRVVASARRGDIVAHKRALIGLLAGGMITPALLSFVPGRLMWTWLVG
ncbi:DUF2306 domain-containing protein [Sphingomonas sp.]|uniref:DUF2306 domain-containing protein n=1 Tax=Sphingomonas sp. TaxID=28214 RepID=UPI003CC513FE